MDTYYSDLARSALNTAQGELQKTQHYLRDAGFPDEIREVQEIIENVRCCADRLILHCND